MMTCPLDLYTDYLVSSTGPTTATGLSQLGDGALSPDHTTRWLSKHPGLTCVMAAGQALDSTRPKRGGKRKSGPHRG